MKPLVENRALRHTSDLTRPQILHGRPLTEGERYMNRQERMALWSVARKPATSMATVARKVRDEMAQFKVDDEERRTAVLAMTGPTKGEAITGTRKKGHGS